MYRPLPDAPAVIRFWSRLSSGSTSVRPPGVLARGHHPGAQVEAGRDLGKPGHRCYHRPAEQETFWRSEIGHTATYGVAPGRRLDIILKQDYKPRVLFTEGRSREASRGWRRMRRLRPGFANPGSGGWANAVRPTLRSGRMCNDAISGGAAAGWSGDLRVTRLSPAVPRAKAGGLWSRSAGRDLGVKCHRQRRAAGLDINRRRVGRRKAPTKIRSSLRRPAPPRLFPAL
jgi:hypothetical protein